MSAALLATVIREFGQAIRGDWGSIDGRSIRDLMDAIANAIEETSSRDLVEWRDLLGICPTGGGHWVEYCEPDYCPDGGAR